MGRGSKKPVSFFFLFSAPALLAVRGSPFIARSFGRRSFDRSKNARKRKRLLAVYPVAKTFFFPHVQIFGKNLAIQKGKE